MNTNTSYSLEGHAAVQSYSSFISNVRWEKVNMTCDQNDGNYILNVYLYLGTINSCHVVYDQNLYYTFNFITTPYCPGLFRFLSLLPRILSHGFPSTTRPTIGPWSLDDRLCTLLPYPFISLFPSLDFFEMLGRPLLF